MVEKTLDTIAVVLFFAVWSLGIIILREIKQWLQLPLTCLVTVDLETICRYLIIYDDYMYIYIYVKIVCVSTSRSGWIFHIPMIRFKPILQTPAGVFLNINHWLDKCASTFGCFNTSIQHFLVQTNTCPKCWPTWPTICQSSWLRSRCCVESSSDGSPVRTLGFNGLPGSLGNPTVEPLNR